MRLFLVTAPAGYPVSLTEAKAHLNRDHADDDALIQTLIAAATDYVEVFTHRALLTQIWDLKLDAFPCGAIELPKPPVTSVTSVTYTATDGTSTVWSSALYTTSFPSGPHAVAASLEPAYSEVYPSTRSVVNAVTVRFICGYGAATAVPDSLKAAMKLMIGTWYAQRETVNVGNIVTRVPDTVEALLWPFKSF